MSAIAVRAATADDCAVLAELIAELLGQHDLAAPTDLAGALPRDGFGAAPRFEAVLAERRAEALGMALYYPVYRPSLAGHGLLMEDLYVRPAARREGVGRLIMAHLAGLARGRGCAYVEWVAADGNRAGGAFYRAVGARPLAGKTGYQIDGAALTRLAGGE